MYTGWLHWGGRAGRKLGRYTPSQVRPVDFSGRWCLMWLRLQVEDKGARKAGDGRGLDITVRGGERT